jgi:hypothetical protein
MAANGMCELVNPPEGRDVIINMWICKIKTSDIEVEISRATSTLCCQRSLPTCGHRRAARRTLSLVIMMVCLIPDLVITATMDLEVCEQGIDTAFLYARIN